MYKVSYTNKFVNSRSSSNIVRVIRNIDNIVTITTADTYKAAAENVEKSKHHQAAAKLVSACTYTTRHDTTRHDTTRHDTTRHDTTRTNTPL
jgi:hypothetical protein